MKIRVLVLLIITFVFCLKVYASSPSHRSTSKSSSVKHSAIHWGYEGSGGPDQWGNLSEDYALCQNGKNQSPVDVTRTARYELDKIEFHYQRIPLNIVNNGHTIQVNARAGSYKEMVGKRYNLLQYHFHSPSEHQANGISHAMEMHLVHQNSSGRFAVVGVFMKRGMSNVILSKLWEYMPVKANQENNADLSVNPAELLPNERSYYYYNGSLTTPPCSEGVLWFVLTEIVEVSESQVQAFLGVLPHPNARPTQPMYKRNMYLARE